MGRSAAAEGQFWATESPLNGGYEDRYGVDFTSKDFIEKGKLIPGTEFITRPAPALGTHPGGGIEVVVPSGTVRLDYFTLLDD